MWDAFNLIEVSLGFSIENIILICAVAGGLIFYGKDFTLGLVLHFLFCGLIFLAFLAMHLVFINALILCLIFFVLLSLSLWLTEKKVEMGGFT